MVCFQQTPTTDTTTFNYTQGHYFLYREEWGWGWVVVGPFRFLFAVHRPRFPRQRTRRSRNRRCGLVGWNDEHSTRQSETPVHGQRTLACVHRQESGSAGRHLRCGFCRRHLRHVWKGETERAPSDRDGFFHRDGKRAVSPGSGSWSAIAK
jgi:hypothetical protein